MRIQYLEIKRRDGTWYTLRTGNHFSLEEIIKEEVPYRCGGYYPSDLTRVIRVISVSSDSPQETVYETTDASRSKHAEQELNRWRREARNSAYKEVSDRIRNGITRYMPGDTPTTQSWRVDDYVDFKFEENSEFLTKETRQQLDRFVKEMIELSNQENSKSYKVYNSPENIRQRVRRSQEVDANLAYHKSQVERYSGRTTAQQREWERGD